MDQVVLIRKLTAQQRLSTAIRLSEITRELEKAGIKYKKKATSEKHGRKRHNRQIGQTI